MSVPRDTPPGSPPFWLTASVLFVTALAFLPTLGGGFLGDDFVYVARFHDLPWSQWPRLFTQDWSGGVWGQPLRELRPFAALSFMSDARLFGGNALGYRLTNLALHLLSTAIVLRLAWRYAAGSMIAALVAGLVFGIHPAHAEAVSWITGRVDLQATAAALLFWIAAEMFNVCGGGWRLTLALVAFFLGLFSKELCMFAPLLLLLRWILLDLHVPRHLWLRRAAVLGGTIAVLAIYAVCRRAAFGHDNIGYNLWTDEPAWHRQAGYAGWLVPILPFTTQAEWRAFPSLSALHGIWLALAGVVAVGYVVTSWRRAHLAAASWFFGGMWYFLTVFPLTGVVYFSPRHLYFPSVGLALALGLIGAAGRWRAALAAIVVAWCTTAHFEAIQPWRFAAGVSREALAALDRELARSGPDTLAMTAVPETLGPVWLWAWSSPQCVSAPFLAHPVTRVIERQVNYSRSDHWFEERKPLAAVRSAPEAVALFVDPQGHVFCRRIEHEELQRAAERLALAAPTGVSSDAWTDWVKSLAKP